MNRRRFFALAPGVALALWGCGTGSDPTPVPTPPPAPVPAPVPVPTPAPTPVPPLVWSVPTTITITRGGPAFDLRTTLPAGAKSGGAFSAVPPTLPTGVVLSANGLLTAGLAANPGAIAGISFQYVEP